MLLTLQGPRDVLPAMSDGNDLDLNDPLEDLEPGPDREAVLGD